MLDGSDWEYRTANTLHVTDDQFESFHAKVKQKLDRHLNGYEGKSTLDQVGTYSVSSRHEHNHEDNQRRIMKIIEELTELLPTETTHIMKTNEQSLKQAKPNCENPFHAEVIRLTIDIGKMCDRSWYHTSEHSTRYL